jgi:hypothetical protein
VITPSEGFVDPIPEVTVSQPGGFARRVLVLEGGEVMGAYAFGCMLTFAKAKTRFKAVTGTSVGALNAILWATKVFSSPHSSPVRGAKSVFNRSHWKLAFYCVTDVLCRQLISLADSCDPTLQRFRSRLLGIVVDCELPIIVTDIIDDHGCMICVPVAGTAVCIFAAVPTVDIEDAVGGILASMIAVPVQH